MSQVIQFPAMAAQGKTLVLPSLGNINVTQEEATEIKPTTPDSSSSDLMISSDFSTPDSIPGSEITSSTDSQNKVLIALGEKAFYLNINEDYQKAEEVCNQALVLDPEDPKILSMRGWALLGLGQVEKALEALDASLAVKPDSALTLCNKACALFRLGRYEEAITTVNHAETLDPLNRINKEIRTRAQEMLDKEN